MGYSIANLIEGIDIVVEGDDNTEVMPARILLLSGSGEQWLEIESIRKSKFVDTEGTTQVLTLVAREY